VKAPRDQKLFLPLFKCVKKNFFFKVYTSILFWGCDLGIKPMAKEALNCKFVFSTDLLHKITWLTFVLQFIIARYFHIVI
jgi:hypothetical protein